MSSPSSPSPRPWIPVLTDPKGSDSYHYPGHSNKEARLSVLHTGAGLSLNISSQQLAAGANCPPLMGVDCSFLTPTGASRAATAHAQPGPVSSPAPCAGFLSRASGAQAPEPSQATTQEAGSEMQERARTQPRQPSVGCRTPMQQFTHWGMMSASPGMPGSTLVLIVFL